MSHTPPAHTPAPASHWLRVGQAARILQLSETRVRQLADSGQLESARTALGRLISPSAVERYQQTHTSPDAG